MDVDVGGWSSDGSRVLIEGDMLTRKDRLVYSDGQAYFTLWISDSSMYIWLEERIKKGSPAAVVEVCV